MPRSVLGLAILFRTLEDLGFIGFIGVGGLGLGLIGLIGDSDTTSGFQV